MILLQTGQLICSKTGQVYLLLTDIIWTGTQFVVVGLNVILTSPDGVKWTLRKPGIPVGFPNGTNIVLNAVAWDGSKLVAVGGTIQTSTDGITWTADSSLDALFNLIGFNDIVWTGSQFVAVGWGLPVGVYNGTAVGKVATSPDGVNWTLRVDSGEYLSSIVWSGSQLVAAGPQTLYSSADGVTWAVSSTALAASYSIYKLSWTGNKYVAVGWGGGDIYQC